MPNPGLCPTQPHTSLAYNPQIPETILGAVVIPRVLLQGCQSSATVYKGVIDMKAYQKLISVCPWNPFGLFQSVNARFRHTSEGFAGHFDARFDYSSNAEK